MCGSNNVTTTTQPPAAVLANYQDVTNQAKSVASTPYQAYNGELVAGINQGQSDAIGELQSSYGAANPYYNAGSGYLNNAASGLGAVQPYLQAGTQAAAQGQNYAGLAAGLNSPGAVSQYENPYTQDVINSTMANLNANDAIQSQQLSSNAIGQGAFGGDRAGIGQADLARQQDLANNQTVAGLNSANYSQALAASQAAAGIYGNLANSANQSAGLYNSLGQTQGQTAAAQGQLSGLAGYLGSAAQTSDIQGASAALQGSTLQQQNQQQQDQAAYQQYLAAFQYPFQTTSYLANIDEGIGQNSGGSSTSPGPSTLSQVTGAATAGLGILGAVGGSSGVSGGLSTISNGISSLFSDKRLKEDIKPIGKTYDGQTMYRFRYKGDPTVHTGLMAQDVEKRNPDAVHAGLGGFKMVDYGAATDKAAKRGRYARGGGLAAGRPHYLDGGDVGVADPTQSNPSLNFASSGLVNGPINLIGAPPSGGLASGHGAVSGPRGPGGTSMPVLGASPSVTAAPGPPAGLGAASGAPAGGSASDPNSSQSSYDKWSPIIAAGFGAMAGQSPFALSNIGAGGLAGLRQYQDVQATNRANAIAQSDVAYKQGALGLEKQKENFAEAQSNRLLQAAQDASNALKGQTGAAGNAVAAGAGTAPPPMAPGNGATTMGVPPAATAAAPGAAAGSDANANFWSGVPDAYNPNALNAQAMRFQNAGQIMLARGNQEGANQMFQQADKYRQQAENINVRGTVMASDGTTKVIPGFNDAQNAKAAATTSGQEAAKAPYDFVQVQPTPGGPTYSVPKSQLVNNPNANVVAPGAGSPPGSALDQAVAQNPIIAKQPEFFAQKQDAIAKDESAMADQFQQRQISKQRLQVLGNMLSTFQTGAFADEKASLVAQARSIGLDVPDTATANPAAFQTFMKDATANVFSDVKAQGGKVLVSEIAGLTKANANAEMSPAANAAIIGQGLGIINYEDQHYKDYTDWKAQPQNQNATTTAPFEIPWVKNNPVQKFVDAAGKGIAPLGVPLPAKHNLIDGQAYMTKQGRAVWDAKSQSFTAAPVAAAP